MNIAGDRVLVTGGARGAGRGIALAFAEAGCDVAVLDLLGIQEIDEAARETVRMIEKRGRRALAVSADVRSEDYTRAAVTQVEENWGGIDHLVVNAGIISSGEIDVMELDAWHRVLDINLTGAWISARAVVPSMKERRRGTITVISSVAATRGGAEYTAYCASKAGLLGMVRALSHELAPSGVRVNAILPGYVATDMWLRTILGGGGEADAAAVAAFEQVIADNVPLGRPQTAADLGAAAVYLATADSVTGTELVVDGGRLAGP